MSHELRDFQQQVLQRSHEVPVVVDFWASWCGPCKMLGPILEKLAGEAAGRWDLVKVNTEEHAAIAAEYSISSIPAVKLFRRGAVADEFVGFRPEKPLREWIGSHLDSAVPTDGADAPNELEQAAEMIDDGRLAEARPLLERLLAANPKSHAARLLFAEVLLTDDPSESIHQLAKVPAEANERPHADALCLIASAVVRSTEDFAEDPVRKHLLDGLAALRRRDWDAALGAFVEVTERRSRYAGGLAGDTGKAIFRYLGIRHPIVDKYYRRFSSALNS